MQEPMISHYPTMEKNPSAGSLPCRILLSRIFGWCRMSEKADACFWISSQCRAVWWPNNFEIISIVLSFMHTKLKLLKKRFAFTIRTVHFGRRGEEPADPRRRRVEFNTPPRLLDTTIRRDCRTSLHDQVSNRYRIKLRDSQRWCKRQAWQQNVPQMPHPRRSDFAW